MNMRGNIIHQGLQTTVLQAVLLTVHIHGTFEMQNNNFFHPHNQGTQNASSGTHSFQFKINIGYFTVHGLEFSIFQLDFNLRIHTHYISLV